MMRNLRAILFLLAFVTFPVNATTYYISPNGSDSNNCTAAQSASTPKKTFVQLFACGGAGDEFILMSTAAYTTYAGATTGYMSYDDGTCSNCEQPPSGTSTSIMTIVRTTDTTKTTVVNSGARQYSLFVGRSTRKDKFIKIQGITFEGGWALYNSDHIYLKDVGAHGAFQDGGDVAGIGTSDGNWGNTFNLIENCWVWGKNRLILSNYRADYTIWRQVVVRGDGCGTAACTGSGNPNVGFTVYNSSNVSVQNMLIVDRVLGGGEPYADFATAQHDAGPFDQGAAEYNQRNQWFGCASINSADTAMNSECDSCTSPSVTIKDMALVNPAGCGADIGNANVGVTVQNLMVIRAPGTGCDGLRLAPGVTGGSVFNVVVASATRYSFNSSVQPSYSDSFAPGDTDYNQTTCATGCLTTNPRPSSNPSIKYPFRIESGSALYGTGSGSGNYGPTILYGYGEYGTFAGEASSNTITTNQLWPWPNQTRMKTEMCAGIATNWCGTANTFTEYTWQILGNTIPANIYGSTTTATTPPTIRATGVRMQGVKFQ